MLLRPSMLFWQPLLETRMKLKFQHLLHQQIEVPLYAGSVK